MKKPITFVFFLLGFIALVGSLPIKADEVNVNGPYIDTPTLTQQQINDLTNTTLLLEYLRNGGTIDVNNTSSNYTEQDLFDDFGDFVRDVLNGRDTGIDFIDFINPFQSQLQYNGLQKVGLPKSAITNFMGWLPFFALSQDEDEPEVNPDVAYLSYIDNINGNGFYFKLWQQSYGQGYENGDYYLADCSKAYPYGNYSWFATNVNNFYDISENGTHNSYGVAPITDINIFYANDEYNLSVSPNYIDNQFSYYSWAPVYYWNIGLPSNNIPSYYQSGNWNTTNVSSIVNNNNQLHTRVTTYTYHGTLEEVFIYCAKTFKNVNIYVDGVPWSIVGQSTNYSLDISTGTSVATNDYDYVHWVYDYEIYFRIDQIWDLLGQILQEIRNPSVPSNPRPSVISWPDFSNLIYDVDGNQAVGVKVLTPDTNIDEDYISNYGPLVPVFVPLFTPVIDDADIVNIISAPMDAIPSDLLDVFGYLFIGTLFVCFIHRLLE